MNSELACPTPTCKLSFGNIYMSKKSCGNGWVGALGPGVGGCSGVGVEWAEHNTILLFTIS